MTRPVVFGLSVLVLAGCSAADGRVEGSADEIGTDESPDVGESAEASTTDDETSSSTSSSDTSSSSDDTSEADTDTADTDGDPGFGPWCDPPPACDGALPPPGQTLPWNNLDANLTLLAGSPNHRVRDLFYVPGETQWLLGKFSYGDIDKDMTEERVDVYVQRNCAGPWELLGFEITTDDGDHPTVQGVPDTGGWAYFEVPADKLLELGRHRVHMVMRGDASTATGFVEVVEPGTPIFLSDVDGTLTSYETEEFVDLLTGEIPDANLDSAAALQALQDKGFHAMYLTARPEWLVERTREFIDVRDFPPGIIHTTLSFDGALGGAAVTYKTSELQQLMAKGLVPTWVFGNTNSDADAYENGGILPLDHRVFFQFDDPNGGRTITSYTELLAEFAALRDPCR